MKSKFNFLFTLALMLITAKAQAWRAPLHVVYVESNVAQANGNSIFAYHYNRAGQLTPVKGSPFLTGGAGFVDSSFALGPFDSDQNIATDDDHHFLFAVNSGSNSVSVFTIQNDGSLRLVPGSPFASHGVQPVSIGYTHAHLVVVNKHQDPAQAADTTLPNYTVFEVGPNGSLHHVANSTIEVKAGSSPSQALARGRYVFGADFMAGVLQSLVFTNGKLVQNKPLPVPESAFKNMAAAPRAPLGLEFHPHAPVVYLGLPTVSQLAVYQYDFAGALKFVRSVPNSGKAICWVKADRLGRHLYTVNSADKSLSVYALSSPLAPQEVQHVSVTAKGGLYQLTLEPEGRFIFTLEQRDAATIPQGQGNGVHVLKLGGDGSLQEAPGLTIPLALPGDTRPQGLLAL